ncbi:ribosomal RNA small subunit methyltransferase B [Oceanobacillus oncorhynchi subsp. incaldanensis]|uniref:16S rRNA (cytosine(967)-C(5))-methyltransferase RsmB n=1 Tax=Oceanobacillus oncorhynchi TaxID=545501 RepID=UPI001B1A6131|nr:16S rRNA (cytosine(967)-C(5))-methyltransferase RsmB [Oceanobacillus oncorhynchi]GIO18330.1 ribosomal RNA small subunit methyltransferase B [Oceanobacillus oncorhynchi subsp. incaldanensis]
MKYQLRQTMLDVLIRIEKDKGYSNLLLNQELKQKGLIEKDKRLLTEVVYGTIQNQITIDYYLAPFIKNKKKIDVWVKQLLRMSVYQMVYLEKIPDHAVLHESVEIAKIRGHKGIASFVNGILRSMQRDGLPDLSLIKDPVERISVETSHPLWLVERWIEMYGKERTEAMCHENLKHFPMSIRIQPMKTNRETVIEQLEREGFMVSASQFSPQGILIEKGNIFKTNLLQEGFITIQDQSSMLAAESLKLEPGMKVLDTCSAPGGKVTHIAEKMTDQGDIHAYDLHQKKVKLIEEKAAVLNLHSISAHQGDARKLNEKYEEASFDRILIDAPCSGLGVINGKPEIKYEKQVQDIERLAAIQLDIVQAAAKLLKPDGLLIYSTCTVDKEENNQVIQKFLEKNDGFSVDLSFREDLSEQLKQAPGWSSEGLQLFPQDFQTDGFFLTRIKRNR